jgi:hypothetical protein
MNAFKIMALGAVTVMVLGVAGTAPKAQAHDGGSVTGIELNMVTEMQKPQPARKCIKKPKRVPGTGGPAQLPPGYRWC